jgi:hypothetical protein
VHQAASGLNSRHIYRASQPELARTCFRAALRNEVAKAGSSTAPATTIAPTHRDKRNAALACVRPLQIDDKDREHAFQYHAECALHRRTASRNIGRHSKCGTRPVVILKVLARQVGVHDHAGQLHSLGTGVNVFTLPIFRRIEARELQQGLAVEVVFGREVPVETTACQTGLGHDLVDRHLRKSLSVEQPSRASENSIAGSLLVLSRVGHARTLHFCDGNHSELTKDVLEHL